MSGLQPPPVKPPTRGPLLQKPVGARMTFPRVAHISAYPGGSKSQAPPEVVVRVDPNLRGSTGGSAAPTRSSPLMSCRNTSPQPPTTSSPMMSSRAIASSVSSQVPLGGTGITRSPEPEHRTLVWKDMPPPSVAAPAGAPAAGVSSTPVSDTSHIFAQAPPTQSPVSRARGVSPGSFLATGLPGPQSNQMIEGKRRVDPPKVTMTEGGGSAISSPEGRRRYTMPAPSNVLRPEFLPAEPDADSLKGKKKQFVSRNRSPSPMELPLEETSRKGQPYNTRSTPSLINLSDAKGDHFIEGIASVESNRSASALADKYENVPSRGGHPPHNASSGVSSALKNSASSFTPLIKAAGSKSPSGANSPRSTMSRDSAIVHGIFEENPILAACPRPGWRHQDSTNVKSAISSSACSDIGDLGLEPHPKNDSRNVSAVLSPVSEDRSEQVLQKSRRQRSPEHRRKNVSSGVGACLSPIDDDPGDGSRPSKSPGPDRKSRWGNRLQGDPSDSSQRSPSPWATDMEVVQEIPAAGDVGSAKASPLTTTRVESTESKGIHRRINSTSSKSPSPDRSRDSLTAAPRKGRGSPRAQAERVHLSPPPYACHNTESLWVDDEVAIRLNKRQGNSVSPGKSRNECYDPDPLLEAKLQLRGDSSKQSHRSLTPRASGTPRSTPRSTPRGTPREITRNSSKSPRHSRHRGQGSWLEKVHTRLQGAILHAEALGPGGPKAGTYTPVNESSRYDELKNQAAQRPRDIAKFYEADRTDSRDRPDDRPPVAVEDSPYVARRSLNLASARRGFSADSSCASNASCSESPYPGKRDFPDVYSASSDVGASVGAQFSGLHADIIGQAVDQIIQNNERSGAGQGSGEQSPKQRRRPTTTPIFPIGQMGAFS